MDLTTFMNPFFLWKGKDFFSPEASAPRVPWWGRPWGRGKEGNKLMEILQVDRRYIRSLRQCSTFETSSSASIIKHPQFGIRAPDSGEKDKPVLRWVRGTQRSEAVCARSVVHTSWCTLFSPSPAATAYELVSPLPSLSAWHCSTQRPECFFQNIRFSLLGLRLSVAVPLTENRNQSFYSGLDSPVWSGSRCLSDLIWFFMVFFFFFFFW